MLDRLSNLKALSQEAAAGGREGSWHYACRSSSFIGDERQVFFCIENRLTVIRNDPTIDRDAAPGKAAGLPPSTPKNLMRTQTAPGLGKLFNHPLAASVIGIGIGYFLTDMLLPVAGEAYLLPILAAFLLVAPVILVICIRFCVYQERNRATD